MTIEETKSILPDSSSVRKGDKFIWGIYIMLFIISLIESYSASSREVASAGIYYPLIKHLILLLTGTALMFTIQHFHYKYVVKCIYLFAILTLISLVFILYFGDNLNGAARSITIAGISIQPPEFAKIAIVLFLAKTMAKNQMVEGINNRGVWFCAIAVIAFGGLLFTQGLTNTILLMAISLSMMLIGGIQWKKFFTVLAVYAIFALAFMAFKTIQSSGDESKINMRDETWVERVNRFFDKTPLYEQDISSINQQEMFSRMAQAHGGIFGVLPGNSRECSRLPLAFSDYIFSIIVEESGIVGGLFVILLYLSLLSRAGFIASRCSRALPSLLVMGMAVMITYQALFHLAINTGFFPVSGQPLPIISKGGTSIIVTNMAFGIMLSISKFAATDAKSKDAKAEANELPEDLQAINPTQI